MMFSIAFSNIFNKQRQALEYILAVHNNQTFNLMTQRPEWQEYKKKAEEDFTKLCDEYSKFIDSFTVKEQLKNQSSTVNFQT